MNHSERPYDERGQAGAATAELDARAMTPDQRSEAKRYGHRELICDLADKALDVAFLAVMAFWAARPLDGWLYSFAPMAEMPTLRLSALFVITIGLHLAVSFPLSFYAGHVLEHQFHLSKQSFAGWLARYAKRTLLAVVFGLAMFVGLYWLIWIVGPFWWLVAAAAFFAVSVLLGQIAPVLILPLFYKIERLDDEELSGRLNSLAEGTGLSIEGVYRMVMSEETAKANAMLAGLGRTRRVLLGDTLLDNFTAEEIEVIFAHEIGHHVHRHIPKMIAAGAVYSAVGFWVCDRLMMAYAESVLGANVSYAAFPVWTLPLLMLTITLFSLVLEPPQNAVSRRYERQCDRYALVRTQMPDAYVSAFHKLAKLNKDDPEPHPLEVFLFHSHPPIAERIGMADK